MNLAASIFDLLDSNAIIVLVAVIFAAVKAFLERGKAKGEEEVTQDDTDFDPYQQYEAELERQGREFEMAMPASPPPPPLTNIAQPPPLITEPTRPKLSEAESKALANLNLHSRRKSKPSGNSTKTRVYRHLSSPTAAREALLLAEILGPPKALKDES